MTIDRGKLEDVLRNTFENNDLSDVAQPVSIEQKLEKINTSNEQEEENKTKFCSKCKRTLLLKDYRYGKYIMGYCKDCYKTYQKHLYALKRGNNQGTCPICLVNTKLVFDHHHTDMKERGRICRSCNAGLGMFNDSLENLNRAIEYLQIYENKKSLE